MSPVLLDTDILSEYFRGNSKVISRVKEYLSEFDKISLSIITYYEILNGLLYKDARKQLQIFQEFVSLNDILPLTIDSVNISAEIQASLRKKGIEIGHTDTLIAVIAISHNMHLATNNIKHFKRIADLKLVNWMK